METLMIQYYNDNEFRLVYNAMPVSSWRHVTFSYYCDFNVDMNPFLANFPILYLLKTTENQRFSGVFRGFKMGTSAKYELNLKTKDVFNTLTNIWS